MLYSQVIKLLDKSKIKEISCQTSKSEAYVKRFDGYTHLVVMLFGVLKHFDFLREHEIGMKAEVNKLNYLGIDYVAKRSTVAEANKRRYESPYRNKIPCRSAPMVVQVTSVTKHDHYLLKEVHLPEDFTLVMDRAYVM